MAWQDTLIKLRDSVAKARADKQRQAEASAVERQEHREKLQQMADSLGIPLLLHQMNTILLEGRGEVETSSSWEPLDNLLGVASAFRDLADFDEDDGDDFDDEIEADVISSVLSWDEGGERELVVDLGWDEDGLFLEVNGEETRHDQAALERALAQAFKDELGL